MASQFIDLDMPMLRGERRVLEEQILKPLREIKASVSASLTLTEVRDMIPFLRQDVKQDTLNQIQDGQTLIAVLNLYYGRDNLKVLERLLRKINCFDLLRNLQEWRANNVPMEETRVSEFGYFPLWLKIRTTFSQFYKNKMRLLKTLKVLFDVPEVDSQDPDEDLMVYMAVSLGKSDILISFLLPLCMRPHIRAQLVDREVNGALEHLGITGVYFARKEKRQQPLPHCDGYLSESTESLSSTVTNDSMFEKPTMNYLDPRMRSIMGETPINGYSRVNGDCHSFSGKNLAANKEDHVTKINGFIAANRPQMADLHLDSSVSEEIHLGRRGKSYDKPSHSETHLAIQKSSDNLDRQALSSTEGLADEKLVVVEESLHEHQDWQRRPRSQFGLVARYHQEQGDTIVYENSKENPVAGVVILKGKKPFDSEEFAQKTKFQSETIERGDHPAWYSNEQSNTHDIMFQGVKEYSGSDLPEVFDNERSLPLDSFKMARAFGIVAKREPQATNPGFSNCQRDKAAGNNVNVRRKTGVAQQLETVDQNGDIQLERLSHQTKGVNNRVNTQVLKANGNADIRNSSIATKEFSYQEAEPEALQWYMQKDTSYEIENISQYPHEFSSDAIASDDHRPNMSSRMDQNRPEMYNSNLSSDPFSYIDRVPSPPSKHNRESHPLIVQLQYSQSDQVEASQPFEQNLESQELMDQVPSTQEEVRQTHVPYFEHENLLQSPTLYTQYKDERVGYLEGHPRHSIIFMKADSDVPSEPHMEYGESVFTDSSVKMGYDSDTGSHKEEVAPPPYHPPPDYKKAKESLMRKSHKSVDESSSSSDVEHGSVITKQLLSSASISTLYREKRGILDEEELQKSVRSANEKEIEKQLELCKDLLFVAKSGDDVEARRLIGEGADVNYHNEFGQTAAIIGSREGNLGIVEALLSAQADLNQREGFGKSALHEAAWKGEHQVAHRLISGGADINITDEEGRTPLHYASMRGRRRIVELLLLFGADATMLNKDGESAAENAYCYKHNDIMDLLLSSRDKKTRKIMEQQIRKKKLQDMATSLPNLTKSTSFKDVSRSKSRPELRKRKQPCVIQ